MPHPPRGTLVAGIATVAVVLLIAVIALGGAPLDGWLHSWVLEHRTERGIQVAVVVTTLGLSGVTVPTTIITAAAATPGGWRPRTRCALVAAAIAVGAAVCRYGLSVLIGRDRGSAGESWNRLSVNCDCAERQFRGAVSVNFDRDVPPAFGCPSRAVCRVPCARSEVVLGSIVATFGQSLPAR